MSIKPQSCADAHSASTPAGQFREGGIFFIMIRLWLQKCLRCRIKIVLSCAWHVQMLQWPALQKSAGRSLVRLNFECERTGVAVWKVVC